MFWRVAAASVIGSSHLKSGQPCQDSSRAVIVESQNGPVLVCVVSDGAGSAARSEIGSSIATGAAIFLIESFLRTGHEIQAIQRETALSWLAQIQNAISSIAHESGLSLREYACTLLAAIIGPERAVFFQVGDGAIVVSEGGEDGWAYVFWPQHGEYVNTTNFITSSDALEVMEFDSVARRVESVAAFSDGIENLVLNNSSRTVHERFFNAMLNPVKQATSEGINAGLSEGLQEYLSSQEICDRTDDDKSLILASRSSIESNSGSRDVAS